MQNKITAGPWTIDIEYLSGEKRLKTGVYSIGTGEASQHRAFARVYSSGNSEANAQAIAAVPELIEALQELLKWADYMGGFESKQWGAAKKALAKAGV